MMDAGEHGRRRGVLRKPLGAASLLIVLGGAVVVDFWQLHRAAQRGETHTLVTSALGWSVEPTPEPALILRVSGGPAEPEIVRESEWYAAFEADPLSAPVTSSIIVFSAVGPYRAGLLHGSAVRERILVSEAVQPGGQRLPSSLWRDVVTQHATPVFDERLEHAGLMLAKWAAMDGAPLEDRSGGVYEAELSPPSAVANPRFSIARAREAASLILICLFGLVVGGVIKSTADALNARRRSRRSAANRCAGCGYDRAGLADEACPECGEPAPGNEPRNERADDPA